MMVYDVCNDYSLDPADHKVERSNYFSKRIVFLGKPAILLYEKHTNELHYFIGDEGLTGLKLA